jgi:hypothetical protein
MAIYSLAGTTVSIGTTATIDFSTESAARTAFAADTYVPIAECETISDFGDTAADVPFTSLTDARTRHLKGSTDGGSAEITCAEVSTDAGQAAVKAASAAGHQDEYNIKFAWPNGDVGYIRGPVMAWSRVNGTGPDNVMKRQFAVSNNYGEIVVLAF